MNQTLSAKEFIALAERKGWQLHAIKKEVPPGSGRWLLFGFEYNKRSRKHRHKFIINPPIELNALAKGPIIASTIDSGTGAEPAQSPVPSGL